VWIGIGAMALLVASGCDRPQPAATKTGRGASSPDPVVAVETARILRGPIIQRISAPGSLFARRESLIGPEVQGRIQRVHVSEGDRVEAGAPLFEIDPQPYEFARLRAEAALDRMRAERRQIEADLARAEELRSRNVVAEQAAERLTNAVDVARAAEREASEALALARRNLEQTVVRAPYAGSVAKRLADEGTTALVQPQTVVIVFQETSELEAHATIPEVHFAAIQVGDAALLHVDGLHLPIEVDVTAVSDTIDPATRTYLVVMQVPNLDHELKAGVFARVDIFPEAKSRVILVPREALRSEDGRTYVLSVKDGRAVAAPVKVGIVGEMVAEVLGGIAEGDEVIVGKAARTLGPGMRVRAVGNAHVGGDQVGDNQVRDDQDPTP
jgi:RND family efflux transporter MFP subunit